MSLGNPKASAPSELDGNSIAFCDLISGHRTKKSFFFEKSIYGQGLVRLVHLFYMDLPGTA